MFISGVNNTDDMTPTTNSSSVTTTPEITFFLGVVGTGKKYPKSLKFIAGKNRNGPNGTIRGPGDTDL